MSWYWHGTKRQKTGQWTLDRTVDSGTGHQRRTPDMDTGQDSGQWDRTPEADTGHWTLDRTVDSGQWTVGPDTRGGHRTKTPDTGQDRDRTLDRTIAHRTTDMNKSNVGISDKGQVKLRGTTHITHCIGQRTTDKLIVPSKMFRYKQMFRTMDIAQTTHAMRRTPAWTRTR